jgi:hypothetical protein
MNRVLYRSDLFTLIYVCERDAWRPLRFPSGQNPCFGAATRDTESRASSVPDEGPKDYCHM